MAEWTTATVAEIAAPAARAIAIGPFGSAMKSELYSSDGIPVVRGQDILAGNRLSDVDQVFVPEGVAARFPACIVQPGDLVMPHRGAIGRVGIVREREMLLSSSMMKLTVDRNKVDPEYVFYYFRGEGRSELLARASTVGTPGIGQPLTSLKGIPIFFPALGEQRAVAGVLGALDDKIVANDRVARIALELARLIYASRVNGVETEPMSAALTPLLGGTPKRSDESLWGGSVPWASAKDITAAPHGVVIATSELITEAASSARLRPLPPGSVVLTARGTVGAVARLGVAASINQSCYGFLPDVIPAGCLFFAVQSAATQARLMAHGSVFDTITMKTFGHVNVPRLTADAWAQVETGIAPLLDSSAQAVRESRVLSATRDELLPLLMSGKVRVKDAEKAVEDVV